MIITDVGHIGVSVAVPDGSSEELIHREKQLLLIVFGLDFEA